MQSFTTPTKPYRKLQSYTKPSPHRKLHLTVGVTVLLCYSVEMLHQTYTQQKTAFDNSHQRSIVLMQDKLCIKASA